MKPFDRSSASASRRGWRGRYGAILAALCVGGALASTPRLAFAKASPSEQVAIASSDLDAADRDLKTAVATARKAGVTLRSATQMLADGDLLFRLKDFQRAILVFEQVQFQYADDKPSYAEAVYRAGEALYATHDYLSARSKFKEVAANASKSEYRPYASRAIARLVDVSLRVDSANNAVAMNETVRLIEGLAPGDRDSVTQYAYGKALYFTDRLGDARAALANVGADGGFAPQARYLAGVIALRQATPGKYQAAIESFRKVVELPGDTDEHREVVDLAWLAIGRLFYEMEQLDDAVLAYQHIDRTSKHFDTMLYEIAWVHVRQEDQERATRALDLLSLAAPDSQHSIEGELLKAEILLRKAEFKRALEAFDKVRDDVTPNRDRIERYLTSGKSPADYYERLTSTNAFDVLDGPDSLPPMAIALARKKPDGALAFSVVESVQETKELLGQAQEMLDKLKVVVNGPNPVRAAPELKNAFEHVLGVANRVSVVRGHLGQSLDDVEPDVVSGDIAAIRDRRRELQKRILGLPVDDTAFAKREEEDNTEWRKASQELQAWQLEIDKLAATAGAIRRLQSKGSALPPERQRELDEVEADIATYKKKAGELRKQIDVSRTLVGVGSHMKEEDELRSSYADLLEREIDMVARLGGDAGRYATSATPILKRARVTEVGAIEERAKLDRELSTRTKSLKDDLDARQVELDSYRDALAKFDEDAKNVVGAVAKRNLELVRDDLTSVVMRAEVGRIDTAWNEREVRKLILRSRQNELKEQERLLDDELRQITSDGVVE